MKVWKCPACGQWVPNGYSRHAHIKADRPTLAAMIAQRRASEMGIATSALDDITRATTYYWRTGNEETKDVDL